MSGETATSVEHRPDDCVALDDFDEPSPAPESEENVQGSEPDADSFASASTPPDHPLQLLPEDNVANKKRVSFPETLIISFLEPPDPWSWRHVVPCTRDQVLNAYKRSCDAHGIKTISKVIQQLKALENYNIRCDLFSLKGERLDQRHIEALEEVFKRLQFKVLDLEATHLDDEGAIALFEMVEYYESACKVNLAFNRNIGIRGWLACSRMIKRTPCLDCLDVKNCVLNDQSMPILGRSLRLGSVLTILHMENCNLSGRPLMILVAALKLNEPLQELFLADNGLMPSDAIQLGNLLKFNHKLYLLDLRNNHLQDVGLSHLCDGLFEQNLETGLNTLVLWNNQITFQGMSSLTRSLLSTKSLQTLNLGHNHLTSEGIFKLKDGLLANTSLLRIGLQGCRLLCEAAIALAEFIADSPRLLRIDLRDNDIKTAGLMALAQGLRHSKTMTRLDLDKNAKKENGVKDYAEQQRVMQDEILSVLDRNRLDAQCKPDVATTENPKQGEGAAVMPAQVPITNPASEGSNASEKATNDPEAKPDLHLVLSSVPEQALLESPAAYTTAENASSPSQAATTVFFIPDPPKAPPPPPPPLPVVTKKRKMFTVNRVNLPSAERASGDSAEKPMSFSDHIVQFSSSRQQVTIVKKEEDEEETSSDEDAGNKNPASDEADLSKDSASGEVGSRADSATVEANSKGDSASVEGDLNEDSASGEVNNGEDAASVEACRNDASSVSLNSVPSSDGADQNKTVTSTEADVSAESSSNQVRPNTDTASDEASQNQDTPVDESSQNKSTISSDEGSQNEAICSDGIVNEQTAVDDAESKCDSEQPNVEGGVSEAIPNAPCEDGSVPAVVEDVLCNSASIDNSTQPANVHNIQNGADNTSPSTPNPEIVPLSNTDSSIPVETGDASDENSATEQSSAGQRDSSSVAEGLVQTGTKCDKIRSGASESPDSGFQEMAVLEQLSTVKRSDGGSVVIPEVVDTQIKHYVDDVVQGAFAKYQDMLNKDGLSGVSRENASEESAGDQTATTDSNCTDSNLQSVTAISENQHCSEPQTISSEQTTSESNDVARKTEHSGVVPAVPEGSTDWSNHVAPSRETAVAVKSPNFHTDLSVMDMTEELASAMENNGTDSSVLSEPDDFEKQLDEMLASVQSGTLLPQI